MIAIGPFVLCWHSVSAGWSIKKWRYFERSSWRHGTAYLGRLKIVW